MKDIDLGILMGWLKAMARINDKTNYGHRFTLETRQKTNGIGEDLTDIFSWVADAPTYEKITDKREQFLRNIIEKWFYGFQDTHAPRLEDKNKNFSLSDEEWREEWAAEFVDLLLQTTKPLQVWNIRLGQTKGYYANDYDNIILETGDVYYLLHFSVTD
jgi:hypothetical protein